MGFSDDFRLRTRKFAVQAIRFFRVIPKTEEGRIVGRQLLRAATSVAANYRAATRGRSEKEFLAKLGIAVEEADETIFWLEIIEESEVLNPTQTETIKKEAMEITAILSKSQKTMRTRLNSKKA
ncbi:MAG: four helix bundle protein [Flammeovirgaceae bacterium]|jgi:four helix bundle protein